MSLRAAPAFERSTLSLHKLGVLCGLAAAVWLSFKPFTPFSPFLQPAAPTRPSTSPFYTAKPGPCKPWQTERHVLQPSITQPIGRLSVLDEVKIESIEG